MRDCFRIGGGRPKPCAQPVEISHRRDDMAGKTVVTVLPSFAERYMTTMLFDGLEVPDM